jgi:peptidoglycan-associated lipoprotein
MVKKESAEKAIRDVRRKIRRMKALRISRCWARAVEAGSVISPTDSRPHLFEALTDAAGGSATAREPRGKGTNVKEMCNTALWAAFAAAALMGVAAGCQSTVPTTQSATQAVPASEKPEGVAAGKQPAPARSELQTVYFEFDRWELRDEARRALQSNAQQLQASPDWGVVTVMGHCDERGSEEYNLSLGERRAEAVKRYLVDLGIPSSRVRTASFGESRPAVRGEGEATWSRNRRAELSLGTQQASR